MVDAIQHSAPKAAVVTMPFAPVMILVRSNQMLFECALCDTAFSSNQQLVHHVNCQHDLPKPYRCGYCKNSYVRNSQLVKHLRTHQYRPCAQQVQPVRSQPAETLCEKKPQQEKGVLNSADEQEKTCSDKTDSPGIAGDDGLGGDNVEVEYISGVVENSTATHVSDIDNDVPAVVASSTALPTAPSEEPHLLQREQQQPEPTPQKQSEEDLAKSDSENEDTTLEDDIKSEPEVYTEDATLEDDVKKEPEFYIVFPESHPSLTDQKSSGQLSDIVQKLQTKACQSSSSVKNGSSLQCEAVSTSLPLGKGSRARRTRSQKVPSEAEKSPYIKSYKPAMCQYCGLWLKRTYNLKQHIRRKHVMQLDHKCSICERAFSTKFSLKQHIIIHTGEKPFVCEVCGEPFARKENLTCHKNTHTNARPFECKICHKRFNSAPGVSMCKIRHSGVKRYSCDICDRKFMFSTGLNNHLLTHSGLRPVSCHLCDKSYRTKSHLNRHIKRVHPKS
ncbi:hypothetical protein V1264_003565 [Littorina saxatilis]|uniref:C2H2-type domain-containing protein n=1 Tax=Littorina saxatilis TaxID=31220 RepID=A0AAN9G8F3_9CAEN